MAQNFIACGREQELLLPPSLREWLPEGHFAWFLLDAVEEMDLSPFYAAYRLDGHGRPAHDPALMVAVLLYAYARGLRSSRKIERALVEVGVVAIDGTKLHANASKDQNLYYEQIAREILAEADAVDREQDERYGEGQRGDVLPPEFRSSHGRRGWIREAKQRLEERREVEARPIPNSRPERLRECRRRLEEELAVERRAAERQDELWAARAAQGKQPKARPPKPY